MLLQSASQVMPDSPTYSSPCQKRMLARSCSSGCECLLTISGDARNGRAAAVLPTLRALLTPQGEAGAPLSALLPQ